MRQAHCDLSRVLRDTVPRVGRRRRPLPVRRLQCIQRERAPDSFFVSRSASDLLLFLSFMPMGPKIDLFAAEAWRRLGRARRRTACRHGVFPAPAPASVLTFDPYAKYPWTPVVSDGTSASPRDPVECIAPPLSRYQ